MSYLDQIKVEEARDYLRLDSTATDNTLELLIYSACVHFEKQTNHLIYQREKTYKAGSRIYDFPIADTTGLTEKSLYYTNDSEVTLNVGYPPYELPRSIKNCVLDLVMLDFFNVEDDESRMRKLATHRTINDLKRFIF